MLRTCMLTYLLEPEVYRNKIQNGGHFLVQERSPPAEAVVLAMISKGHRWCCCYLGSSLPVWLSHSFANIKYDITIRKGKTKSSGFSENTETRSFQLRFLPVPTDSPTSKLRGGWGSEVIKTHHQLFRWGNWGSESIGNGPVIPWQSQEPNPGLVTLLLLYPLVWWIRKEHSNLILASPKNWHRPDTCWLSKYLLTWYYSIFDGLSIKGLQSGKGNSLPWFKEKKKDKRKEMKKKVVPGSKTKVSVMSLVGIPRTLMCGHTGGGIWEKGGQISAVAMDGFPSWSQQASLAWLASLAWGVEFRRKEPSPVNVSLLPPRKGVARICGLAVEWAVEALSLPFYLHNSLADLTSCE